MLLLHRMELFHQQRNANQKKNRCVDDMTLANLAWLKREREDRSQFLSMNKHEFLVYIKNIMHAYYMQVIVGYDHAFC